MPTPTAPVTIVTPGIAQTTTTAGDTITIAAAHVAAVRQQGEADAPCTAVMGAGSFDLACSAADLLAALWPTT